MAPGAAPTLEALCREQFGLVRTEAYESLEREVAEIRALMGVRGLSRSSSMGQAVVDAVLARYDQVLAGFEKTYLGKWSESQRDFSDSDHDWVLATAMSVLEIEAQEAQFRCHNLLYEPTLFFRQWWEKVGPAAREKNTRVLKKIEILKLQKGQEVVSGPEGHIEVRVGSSPDELDDRLPLFRRRIFDRDLPCAEEELARRGVSFALIMIDVDKFGQLNNTHGHPTGDEVLIAISTAISRRVQGKGKAYRYGGEEISVLLPNYSKMEAVALAETVRTDLERCEMTEKKLTVTASFGVAAAPEDAQTGRGILECADAALLSAKRSGRNLVRAAGDSDQVPGGVRRRVPSAPNIACSKMLRCSILWEPTRSCYVRRVDPSRTVHAILLEIANGVESGRASLSAGRLKAQLVFRFPNNDELRAAPGAWLDEPTSSVEFAPGDTRCLILAVGFHYVQEWKLPVNRRSSTQDPESFEHYDFPGLSGFQGTADVELVSLDTGQIVTKFVLRWEWKPQYPLEVTYSGQIAES